jgi:hypothetical protein
METETVPLRSATTAEWAASTLVLGVGELGVNTDTGEVRSGDGTNVWSSLPRHDGAKARGTAVLVAGTKQVTGLTGVVVGDLVLATVRTLGTVTSAKAVLAVAGAGTVTITSADNTDTSTGAFVVFPA